MRVPLRVWSRCKSWAYRNAYGPARVDAWTTGLTLAAISLGALVAFAEWEEWISLVLGAWMVASPFVLGFPRGAGMKIVIGVGCVVAYLALMELWLLHYGSGRAAPHGDRKAQTNKMTEPTKCGLRPPLNSRRG
jgi:hypothetical protein